MALIHPDGWKELAVSGAAAREIETLTLLETALPDDYRIYHGVHWTRVQQGYSLFGEIDFVVMSPAGKLLLIEQKSGFLTETPDGLAKSYDNKTKSVPSQMSRNLEAIRTRLTKHCKELSPQIETLLYCPDYTVRSPGSSGIPPERIVDASKRQQLPQIIRSLLSLDMPASTLAERMHAFLCDILELMPDANAYAGQAQMLYTRLSGGLAEWAQKIECSPFRLRVIGTAGAGKTQLALSVFTRALAQGKRPLYVCYNRPLADHFTRGAGSGGTVATYHQLADQLYREAGHTPDFTRTAMFEELESFLDAYHPGALRQYDVLIIDEGQDIKPAWKDNLLRLLLPEGKAWWLEDPMQKLYKTPESDFSDWVVLRSETNYRTPRNVLTELSQLLALPESIRSGSPLTGNSPDILTYKDSAGLLDQTKRAITQALGKGYRRDMIALISFRGRDSSQLTHFDKLGPIQLKRFTGEYDLLGNPIYSDGDVLFESVYRFKGQAAPCVILTEVDFETADELTRKKLFVGATRATMNLTLVISERAAQALLAPPA